MPDVPAENSRSARPLPRGRIPIRLL